MLKTTISSVSLAALLLTGAPVFADEPVTPVPTAATVTSSAPASGNVSTCMNTATEKKNAAMKAAEQAYKAANAAFKETKDKTQWKAAQAARKKAQKDTQALFAKERKACTAMAGASEMKKEEKMKEEKKKEEEKMSVESPKIFEKLIAALQEKLRMLEAKIVALEELFKSKSATVALSLQNNSGESGTATLKDESGKVKVTLDLTGAPAGVVQPAHIHMGGCANLGAVKYPLTFPTNGKSETLLDVKWDDLKAALPLAVNVHKSADEATVYVSCGDVKL